MTPHAHLRPAGRRRRPARGVLAALGLALGLSFALVTPGTAMAAPGDLDPTFGLGGRVVTPITGYAEGHDIARQGDGKLVVAGVSEGGFTLARYNPDGSLDPGFDGDGTATSDFGGGSHTANAVAIQQDGKIVVAGTTEVLGDEGGCCFFSVARYNANGSLDTGFGEGGLVRVQEFGGSADGADVAVQSDGRIIAAGKGSGGGFALVRLTTTGSLDPTLGGDGAVVAGFTPGSPQDAGGIARGMALQSDGKIVVVGYVGNTAFDIGVARYNTNGTLDGTFSGDGMVTADFGGTEFGNAVAVQSDGKIVAAGSGGLGFALVRYNSDGALDTGFGSGGRTSVNFPGDSGFPYAMALQTNGKIVVAGRADDPNSSEANDFGIARFNTNGTTDTGFGGDGFVVTGFNDWDEARGVLVQPDGKIVAAGVGAGYAFALARYQGGDGPPPSTPYADLSVTKSGTSTVSIGDRATYTVKVTNSTGSTATATGVTLTDTVSGAGATLVSATPTQGSCTTTATGAGCSLGSLVPGASATVTVVVEPRVGGTLTDTASVSAAQQDTMTSNNSTTWNTTVNNSRGCTIIGTSGADTLTGTYGADVICGLGGDDTIRAGYGNDTVHGGYGNDNIDGGYNDDTLIGDTGNDTLTGYYGNDRLTTTDGVSGNDTANGGYGTDTCTTDPGDIRISCP
ncbi:calcium-binding protein [Streptomyces sp. NPDC053431]|uniref:calcium-binding protein n=1 Tax=Streptomyces sp. NPDC053431 TaxID=3365703 RepID=UPI0037D8C091